MVNFIKRMNPETAIILSCTAPSRFFCDDCEEQSYCHAKNDKPRHGNQEYKDEDEKGDLVPV